MNVPAGRPAAPAPQQPLWQLLDQTADATWAVRQGRSLTDVLSRVPAGVRPAVQALSFHVLRWWGSAGEARLRLAPKTPAPPAESLLLVSLALLWPGEPLPYAEHTLVDQAVTAARRRCPAAAGFINAVLRQFLRDRDTLVQAVRHSPVGAFNHPLWWIEKLKLDWPSHWNALLQAANHRPPMSLRVNRRRGDAEGYRARLAAVGRAATILPPAPGQAPQGLALAQPCAVQELPGFLDGDVSVQDAAAQLAAPLLWKGLAATRRLGPAAGLPRVLDACAAPGGKTAHLLELGDLDLLALDSDPTRLPRVQDNLRRLGLPAAGGGRVRLQAADARQPRQWWDGQPFDAILLDAPCTASGIVRRHPDVRWLRRADDVTALARVQAELLDALWPLLAPGGRLVYATCSIFKAEGERQIDAFLQRQGVASATLDPVSPGHLLGNPDNPGEGGGRAPAGMLPAPPAHDGFYYAVLLKPAAPA